MKEILRKDKLRHSWLSKLPSVWNTEINVNTKSKNILSWKGPTRIKNIWSHKNRVITDKEAMKCQIWVKFFQLLMGWIDLLLGSSVFLVWFGFFLGQVKPSWKTRGCPETYTLVNIPLSLFWCQISDLWDITDWMYVICYSCWTPGNYSCVYIKKKEGSSPQKVVIFSRTTVF